MKIGENIRNARRGQDLTQEQLAEYLNLSVSAVSQWENGKTMPDIALLPALTQMLGVSADELLGIDAEHTKQAVDAYESESARLWRQGDVARCAASLARGRATLPEGLQLSAQSGGRTAAYAVLRRVCRFACGQRRGMRRAVRAHPARLHRP